MDPQVAAAIIAGSVGVITVGATVAVQISGRRKTSKETSDTLDRTFAEQREQLDATLGEQREQLDRTLAEQREQLNRTLAEQRTRTLNERFATAAGQLGSDKPPAVRLAGVYAMAGLADDWPKNRQTCINVLCAYLRLPYEPDPGEELQPEHLAFLASREVRWTVIQVIAEHLRDSASWQDLTFDFKRVVFDGGDFRGAVFSRDSVAVFDGAEFSGGTVRFDDAVFSGGTVRFDGAVFSGGTVSFRDTELSSGKVRFDHAVFSGGTVLFSGARFSGGTVDFTYAKFSGGKVSFIGEPFAGRPPDGTVLSGKLFGDAKFSGGKVYFSHPLDWSFPPAFPWTDTPPPGVKLPGKEDQSPT